MTIAFTATAADPAPSGAINLLHDDLLRHATEALFPGDGKVGLVVQGTIGLAGTTDLTPMRGDEVEADPDKAAEKIDGRVADMTTSLANLHAGTAGLDVLGVLDTALETTPTGGTVIVVTSGLSTTAPVDLRAAGDWMLYPERFAKAIDPANIPHATGRSIVFAGLGYPAPNSKQPVPGTAARTALTHLWMTICRRTGASSCSATDGPASTMDSTSTLDVPVVNLNQVTTTCIGTVTVDGDVAFESESAVLTPGAGKILAPIARSLRRCPADRVVDAIGHAAEVPGGGDGIALSQARAQAVLRRLLELGAPRRVIGTATGFGNTSHQIVDNTPGEAGTYVEKLARLNRVVELVITTRKN
ncbi:OmpA family protein [Nocardioides albidus]|uniref:OmpA family protein n=1 Tax=Nocardioides albidus TaxID=1517589 RepID=A0A5C4VR30_9ACTN|nr:OmpA family protein [Nocardioides albidus]TNM37679.1 OmpA family protein [Nocardioides albidus]